MRGSLEATKGRVVWVGATKGRRRGAQDGCAGKDVRGSREAINGRGLWLGTIEVLSDSSGTK